MDQFKSITYETTGRIARLTLNRPERGNGITLEMPNEVAACVERANLDPNVSVIALAGNGKGFCGGYDLVLAAEQGLSVDSDSTVSPEGSPFNLSQGLYQSQMLGTILDGVARHTKEGYAFQRRSAEAGFKQAVRERDEQFGEPSFE